MEWRGYQRGFLSTVSRFLYTDFSLFNFCLLAPNKPREQREYNLTSGHTSHSAPLSPLLTRAEKHSVSPVAVLSCGWRAAPRFQRDVLCSRFKETITTRQILIWLLMAIYLINILSCYEAAWGSVLKWKPTTKRGPGVLLRNNLLCDLISQSFGWSNYRQP